MMRPYTGRPALCSARHQRHAGAVTANVPAQVHADDVVPLGGRHVEHHARSAEPGVVHDDVDATPLVDRALHQGLARLRSVEMSLRSATASPPASVISRATASAGRLVGLAAVGGDPEVVDHDLGAIGGETRRLGAADAAAAARDHGDAPVEHHTRSS